jgi:uncharacterized membrane protein YgcG
MKKFLVAIMFGFMAIAAQAEATFDQIQTLIQQREYQAAANGLEGIIANHPKSAKAFYAMAQAQAGLGNLEKAQKALNIATGLNPTLDFAPASSVASLKQAITPQTAKIEVIEESHFWRNFAYFALFAGFAVACYFLYSVYARKQEQEQAEILAKQKEHEEAMDAVRAKMAAEREADRKATKSEGSGYASAYTPRTAYRGPTQTVTPTPAPAPSAPSHTTVVNNTSSSSDLLTGVILGNMMSSHDHHHETTRVIEREVPAKAPKSSWDDTPAPSKSSSWDDDSSSSSSKRSSSWDDDSSSSSKSSSSSWSSSSSSDSSSSWDSGSSSSSSSSSWD